MTESEQIERWLCDRAPTRCPTVFLNAVHSGMGITEPPKVKAEEPKPRTGGNYSQAHVDRQRVRREAKDKYCLDLHGEYERRQVTASRAEKAEIITMLSEERGMIKTSIQRDLLRARDLMGVPR